MLSRHTPRRCLSARIFSKGKEQHPASPLRRAYAVHIQAWCMPYHIGVDKRTRIVDAAVYMCFCRKFDQYTADAFVPQYRLHGVIIGNLALKNSILPFSISSASEEALPAYVRASRTNTRAERCANRYFPKLTPMEAGTAGHEESFLIARAHHCFRHGGVRLAIWFRAASSIRSYFSRCTRASRCACKAGRKHSRQISVPVSLGLIFISVLPLLPQATHLPKPGCEAKPRSDTFEVLG